MEIREWNAKIQSTMLGIEDHGIMTFMLHLRGANSGQSAGGYMLDGFNRAKNRREGWPCAVPMLSKILSVVGVETWEELPGKHVRVRSNHEKVFALGHITDDSWIDFQQFIDELKFSEAGDEGT